MAVRHPIARSHRIVFAVFVFVVAPIGAAVIMTALLVVGVPPPLLFAPGFAMLSLLRAMGIHAPNAVGVVTATAVWWLAIVAAGAMWDRRRGAGRARVS